MIILCTDEPSMEQGSRKFLFPCFSWKLFFLYLIVLFQQSESNLVLIWISFCWTGLWVLNCKYLQVIVLYLYFAVTSLLKINCTVTCIKNLLILFKSIEKLAQNAHVRIIFITTLQIRIQWEVWSFYYIYPVFLQTVKGDLEFLS